jgi:hypothetical protein
LVYASTIEALSEIYTTSTVEANFIFLGGYDLNVATNTPQDDFQKTALRLPKTLHAQLHASAQDSGRSYNAEIVARLQQSFEPSVDSAHLQEVAAAHKSTATALGVLSTTMANMLLSAVRLFTPDQRKKLMQIGVWEAIAEGVVQGKGATIVEALDLLNKPSEQSQISIDQKK